MMATYHANTPESVQIRTKPPETTFEITKIREWLPWSIINLFLAWGLGGLLPLIFSIICRIAKRSNDWESARTMSKLALIFNILVTFAGIAGWIGLTIFLILSRRVALK